MTYIYSNKLTVNVQQIVCPNFLPLSNGLYTVNVYVFNARTKQPISNAKVFITTSPNDVVCTDSNGHAGFYGVWGGKTYTVVAEADGYVMSEETFQLPLGGGSYNQNIPMQPSWGMKNDIYIQQQIDGKCTADRMPEFCFCV